MSSLTAGTHTIGVSYVPGSNSDWAGSNASLSESVTKANTSTSLSASDTTPVVGENVTFTANVTAGGSPVTGASVTFKVDGTAIGSAALNSAGVATLSTTSLAAGTHSVVAVYPGDANDNASTSPSLTVTVSKTATATSLAASDTHPAVNQKRHLHGDGDRRLVERDERLGDLLDRRHRRRDGRGRRQRPGDLQQDVDEQGPAQGHGHLRRERELPEQR